jgi:hypothetical protein
MVFWYTGESHSYQIKGGRDIEGIAGGMELLEAENSLYAVEIQDKPGEFMETGVLRLIRGKYDSNHLFSPWGMGEEYYWSAQKVREIVKHAVENNPIDVAGWTWCWDISGHRLYQWDETAQNYLFNLISQHPTGRWQPEHMQIYLDAFAELNANPRSKTIFLYQTATTDISGEGGYRTQLLNNQMRQWVKDKKAVLFDWADIETYSKEGTVQNKVAWVDTNGVFGTSWFSYIYESRHSDWDEAAGDDVGHANKALCIQKAKALWWLLARLAGWDGKISS